MPFATGPAGTLLVGTLTLAAALVPMPRPAAAADPRIGFDFGRTLECRDVTPPDFAEVYPDRRIVECTLRLSVYLDGGDVDEIEAVRIELTDCDRRLRVFDFSPGTRLESELAEDIAWTRTTETDSGIGISLGGELPAVVGDVVAHVTPSVNFSKGDREITTETQVRVAPKRVVVASGTIDEEHGVFFSLRPSPQFSIEGVHELTVAFTVPASWRGDVVRLSCRATGQQKVLWVKHEKVWAESADAVALYLAGDIDARRAAERRIRLR